MNKIPDEILAEYLQKSFDMAFNRPWSLLPCNVKQDWLNIAKEVKVDLKNMGFVIKPVE